MTCSIIGNNVRILMPSGNDATPTIGSALQHPEVSRAHLSALLRRNSNDSAKSSQRTFWSALMAQVVSNNANANS